VLFRYSGVPKGGGGWGVRGAGPPPPPHPPPGARAGAPPPPRTPQTPTRYATDCRYVISWHLNEKFTCQTFGMWSYSTVFENPSYEHWPYEARFPRNNLLKNERKCSSFHADVAGDKLLGHYFLPPRLTGAVYHSFLMKRPPRATARYLQSTIIYTSWMRRCTTFSSCISDILVQQCVSGLDGPPAWPAHFPNLNALHCYLWWHLKCTVFCATEVSDVRDLKQRIQNGWLIRGLEFSSESLDHSSDAQRPVLKPKVDTWVFSVTVRKPCLRRPVCVHKNVFLVLLCRFVTWYFFTVWTY
jgi:hypothetical protein